MVLIFCTKPYSFFLYSIGQEHDFQYQPDHQTKQILLGQPVKNSSMSSVEQGGGEKPPPCETSPVSQQPLSGVEKPPLPPKPSNVVDSVMLTSNTSTIGKEII